MEFTRGDTFLFKFKRVNSDGETITSQPNQMYFTVKLGSDTEEFLFQKTLEDITIDSENYYHVRINPEDTNNLNYGTYFYDIEVITDYYVKTISKGNLDLTEEATFVSNENTVTNKEETIDEVSDEL